MGVLYAMSAANAPDEAATKSAATLDPQILFMKQSFLSFY